MKNASFFRWFSSVALLVLGVSLVTYSCAQSGLVYLKYLPIGGKDPWQEIDTIPQLGWSPTSLAWSNDGKRVAFAAQSARPFGVVDIETKKITPLKSEFKGKGTVHWSTTMNRLALVQDTAFTVYDMNEDPPRALFSVENKFPKVLRNISSAIVSVQDDDYLILAGNTNWRLEPSNPHIAAYSFKTGERKLAYQFLNPLFDGIGGSGDPSMTVWGSAVSLNAQNEILVAVTGAATTKILNEAKLKTLVRPRILPVVNLTMGKIQCNIELRQDPLNLSGGERFLGHPSITALRNAQLILVDEHLTDVFDMNTCKRVTQLETELHRPFIEFYATYEPKGQFPDLEWLEKQKPSVSQTFTSPDGRWVFGRSPWAPKPSRAPFRLWRASDWKLIHDGTYESDGFIDTAAFSQDGQFLAFGSSNRITFYKLQTK